MRNAVEVIYGAIERIDDPLVFGFLITDNSLFPKEGMLGELFQK
jgi:hypothetical protein